MSNPNAAETTRAHIDDDKLAVRMSYAAVSSETSLMSAKHKKVPTGTDPRHWSWNRTRTVGDTPTDLAANELSEPNGGQGTLIPCEASATHAWPSNQHCRPCRKEPHLTAGGAFNAVDERGSIGRALIPAHQVHSSEEPHLTACWALDKPRLIPHWNQDDGHWNLGAAGSTEARCNKQAVTVTIQAQLSRFKTSSAVSQQIGYLGGRAAGSLCPRCSSPVHEMNFEHGILKNKLNRKSHDTNIWLYVIYHAKTTCAPQRSWSFSHFERFPRTSDLHSSSTALKTTCLCCSVAVNF